MSEDAIEQCESDLLDAQEAESSHVSELHAESFVMPRHNPQQVSLLQMDLHGSAHLEDADADDGDGDGDGDGDAFSNSDSSAQAQFQELPP